MQGLIVETEALKCTITQRSNEDVCFFQKAHHCFLAFWALAVDRCPFFVERTAVICNIVEFALVMHTPSCTLSTLFVAREWLDLDDRCAQFTEQTACCRTSCILGEINDDYAFQTCHVFLQSKE